MTPSNNKEAYLSFFSNPSRYDAASYLRCLVRDIPVDPSLGSDAFVQSFIEFYLSCNLKQYKELVHSVIDALACHGACPDPVIRVYDRAIQRLRPPSERDIFFDRSITRATYMAGRFARFYALRPSSREHKNRQSSIIHSVDQNQKIAYLSRLRSLVLKHITTDQFDYSRPLGLNELIFCIAALGFCSKNYDGELNERWNHIRNQTFKALRSSHLRNDLSRLVMTSLNVACDLFVSSKKFNQFEPHHLALQQEIVSFTEKFLPPQINPYAIAISENDTNPQAEALKAFGVYANFKFPLNRKLGDSLLAFTQSSDFVEGKVYPQISSRVISLLGVFAQNPSVFLNHCLRIHELSADTSPYTLRMAAKEVLNKMNQPKNPKSDDKSSPLLGGLSY